MSIWWTQLSPLKPQPPRNMLCIRNIKNQDAANGDCSLLSAQEMMEAAAAAVATVTATAAAAVAVQAGEELTCRAPAQLRLVFILNGTVYCFMFYSLLNQASRHLGTHVGNQ